MALFTNAPQNLNMKNIAFSHLIKLIETLKQDYNITYRLMLFTTNGILIGDLQELSDKSNMVKYTDDPSKITLDVSAVFAKLEEECNVEKNYYNDYSINMVDVSVYSVGGTEPLTRLDQIVIFTDQIIGFTLVQK
ncbi:hypothetical protein AGMMS49975_01100 [Clostridia bacterium]|nr:hypothetical protein AGMMS49975_01100 [Clostridia bacterium]GHU77461.1 hypothetical protein FACS1894188_11770 [Clostridia bacterium]